MSDVVVRGAGSSRTMEVEIGSLKLSIDRAAHNVRSVDLLLAALGSCTLGTINTYLNRKGIEANDLNIQLSASKADGAAHYTSFKVVIDCGPEIDDKTKRILHEVTKTCTIHKTLHGDPEIHVEIV